jgi:hypothetical protein
MIYRVVRNKINIFVSTQVKHDFSCACPTGFTGTNVSLMCDLEINLCYSNPCGQNGVCVSIESGFVCLCEPGYTGTQCETSLNSLKCCEQVNRTQSVCNSISPIISNKPAVMRSERICRAGSSCKNLILGGVVCDGCEPSPSEVRTGQSDASYFTPTCHLRSRHFPQDQEAYLVLAGVRSRFRFKIKLTFATIKSNGFLFYNGRAQGQESTLNVIKKNINKFNLLFKHI